MPRFRSMATACAIAVVAASGATVLPGTAQSEIVRTKISLGEFKEAFDVASIKKRLIDNDRFDGVRFFIANRPKGGNKNNKERFILFRTDSTVVPSLFELLEAMSARVRLQPGGGPTTELTCDLGGTSSSGVTSVQCGGGLTVSPS
jgi:hypothetical protein